MTREEALERLLKAEVRAHEYEHEGVGMGTGTFLEKEGFKPKELEYMDRIYKEVLNTGLWFDNEL